VSGRFSLCGLPQDAAVIGGAFGRTTVPSDQTYIEIDLHP